MEDDQMGPEVDEDNEVVEKLEVADTKTSSGLALASLIISIISLIVSLIPLVNIIAIVLAIIALLLGIIALSKKQGGKAIVGVVLSVLSIIISVGMYVLLGMGAQMISDALDTNSHTEGLDIAEDYSLDNPDCP